MHAGYLPESIQRKRENLGILYFLFYVQKYKSDVFSKKNNFDQ